MAHRCCADLHAVWCVRHFAVASSLQAQGCKYAPSSCSTCIEPHMCVCMELHLPQKRLKHRRACGCPWWTGCQQSLGHLQATARQVKSGITMQARRLAWMLRANRLVDASGAVVCCVWVSGILLHHAFGRKLGGGSTEAKAVSAVQFTAVFAVPVTLLILHARLCSAVLHYLFPMVSTKAANAWAQTGG